MPSLPSRTAPHADPPPTRTRWLGAPRPLVSVCAKAMAHRPEDRYPTADAVLADIEAWQAGQRVAAHPEGVREAAGRLARRHQQSLAVAVAGLVLAVAALGGGLWRAEAQRRAAEDSFRLAFEVGRDSYFNHSDLRLDQADGTHRLRLRLAERGLEHFRELQVRYPDNAAVRQAVALSRLRIGGVYREMGRRPDAVAVLRQALPLLNEMATAPAATPADHIPLIEGRTVLASVLAIGGPEERDEAVRLAGRAEADCRAWLPDDGRERPLLLMYAADVRGLAATDPRVAEAAFAAAAGFADRASAADPTDTALRSWRGLMRLQTAIRQQEQGRLADARATLALARADYDTLGAELGWPPGIRQRAAACENMAGLIDLKDGRHQEAVGRLTRAVELRRELAGRNPDSRDIRGELSTSLSNLGQALLAVGRPRDGAGPAREGSDLAAAVFRADPGREFARYAAGRFRTRAGGVAVALGEWDRAADDFRAAGELLAPLLAVARPLPEHRTQAAEAAVWLGLVEARRGRWREAVAAWLSLSASGG